MTTPRSNLNSAILYFNNDVPYPPEVGTSLANFNIKRWDKGKIIEKISSKPVLERLFTTLPLVTASLILSLIRLAVFFVGRYSQPEAI